MIFSSDASLINQSVSSTSYLFNYPCTSKDICYPIEVKLGKGHYLFELWGASGGLSIQYSGNGSYTRGFLSTENDLVVYLYIGANQNSMFKWSFNGGYSQVPGGGATDVRLVQGEWDDFSSLKSRIMVASGGGGYDGFASGNGVGLGSSTSGHNLIGGNANQTSGGEGFFHGVFGRGGSHNDIPTDGCGSGGGGYYGGGSGMVYAYGSGGGGSCYISGHPRCDGIKMESTYDNIIHTGQSIHYSDIFFRDTKMISGSEEMPSPDGELEKGHTGNGAAKITKLSQFFSISPCSYSTIAELSIILRPFLTLLTPLLI